MIEFEPEPKQVLLMWNLAFQGGERWLKEIPKGMAPTSARKALIRNGLIEEGKRVPEGQNGNRKITFLALEDKGWQWLGDNMDAPIWKSQSATEVLQAALVQLSRHMQEKRIVLGELLSQSFTNEDQSTTFTKAVSRDSFHQDSPREQSESAREIMDRIATTYERLAEHRPGERVRIADVRHALSDIPASGVDDALERMSRAGNVVLNRLDNPKEITAADEEAAFTNSIGEPRHIMHMEIRAHV